MEGGGGVFSGDGVASTPFLPASLSGMRMADRLTEQDLAADQIGFVGDAEAVFEARDLAVFKHALDQGPGFFRLCRVQFENGEISS